MRAFVAVWPPPEVVSVLRAHPRPPVPGLRWTTPAQWHVTLRFLGPVPERLLDPLLEALAAGFADTPPAELALGPVTRRTGRSLLLAPVTGADGLAETARRATATLVPVTEGRPFRGHLTLARAGRRAAVPAPLAGVPVAAAWRAGSVSLVRSTLRASGAEYEDVGRVPLAGEGA